MNGAGPISFPLILQKKGITLNRTPLEIVQVNVGKLCNQTCKHCHVEAGPRRKEMMKQNTMERILHFLSLSRTIHTVDITGGAPELNPHFRYLVQEAAKLGKEVIDRCNLTVFFEEGQQDTPQFLKDHHVQIIASLPCYSRENVDKQRGDGVFDKSLKALRILNDLGYGKEGTGLTLHLVYNPIGAFLPPPQKPLEEVYKKELKELFGIEFNRLYAITNMPIKRFLFDLQRRGNLDRYMDLLIQNFNPQAAQKVMCRNMISIGWDGQIYDCDFNQMLEIPLGWKQRTLWDIQSFDDLLNEKMVFANHCYGCTAGAGSSCSGTLA